MQRVIVSVSNDLSTDKRVDRICNALQRNGYEVLLLGRRKKNSLFLNERSYKVGRMFLLFERGVLFYGIFQMRLFLFLLFSKKAILYSNDLDTLLPNYLISALKKSPLIYDTHELFCEVPELKEKYFKRNIWKAIERYIFPKLKCVFTVNKSIAGIYNQEYNVPVSVIRNVPMINFKEPFLVTKKGLGIADEKKIILLQGAGINKDRGGEEALQAMQYIHGAVLLIVGDGDVLPKLRKMSSLLNITHKVKFLPKMPFEQLSAYTRLADIGLSLDKNTNKNYRYSLPNKLFDYIHAGVPILASNLVEVKNIVTYYQIGIIINNIEPNEIALALNRLLTDDKMLRQLKYNTGKAKQELNWEQEEKKFISYFNSYIRLQ